MAVPSDGDCERDERLVLHHEIVAFYGEEKVNDSSHVAGASPEQSQESFMDPMLGELTLCNS
jgi:hypothetical protein